MNDNLGVVVFSQHSWVPQGFEFLVWTGDDVRSTKVTAKALKKHGMEHELVRYRALPHWIGEFEYFLDQTPYTFRRKKYFLHLGIGWELSVFGKDVVRAHAPEPDPSQSISGLNLDRNEEDAIMFFNDGNQWILCGRSQLEYTVTDETVEGYPREVVVSVRSLETNERHCRVCENPDFMACDPLWPSTPPPLQAWQKMQLMNFHIDSQQKNYFREASEEIVLHDWVGTLTRFQSSEGEQMEFIHAFGQEAVLWWTTSDGIRIAVKTGTGWYVIKRDEKLWFRVERRGEYVVEFVVIVSSFRGEQRMLTTFKK